MKVWSVLFLFVLPNVYSFENIDVASLCSIVKPREEWNGVANENGPKLPKPTPFAIIHTTNTEPCYTEEECKAILLKLQEYCLRKTNNALPFNFLIGEDGNAYEALGWKLSGNHTGRYSEDTLALAFIGTFNESAPNELLLKAALQLLRCGKLTGELDPTYVLYAGKQVTSDYSPGMKVFQRIRSWDHFHFRNIFELYRDKYLLFPRLKKGSEE